MRLAGVILVAVVSLSVCGIGWALDFSADMVSVASGQSFAGKIYVSGEKVRMEAAGAVTISRMDKRVAWVLMPDQNMYMEQPVSVETVAGAAEKMPGEIERTSLGKEAVGGRDAEKFRIVYTLDAVATTIFQWIDQATGIPIKTNSEDGSWTVEYRNIQVGAQPQDVFEIPAGYTKFSMPNVSDMILAAQQESTEE